LGQRSVPPQSRMCKIPPTDFSLAPLAGTAVL
jgi:hypothetical protein